MLEFSLSQRMAKVMAERRLGGADTPVLLMVSGGSDSTALAYAAQELRAAGGLGALAMLHVNHRLRGEDADADERFVAQLAKLLDIPLYSCSLDVAGLAEREGGNVEAVARRERYLAAHEALESLCLSAAAPLSEGRIVTAHTLDDRVESFYMRSIVGTGPGGFRAMRYRNGPVIRPLLDESREELRSYLVKRKEAGMPAAQDATSCLWREDATNAHTDRFRAYVRHEIVPRAKRRNPQLLEVLRRTMNLIADEDDMLEDLAEQALAAQARWIGRTAPSAVDFAAGCVLAPAFGALPLPVQRRAALNALRQIVGGEARVESAAVDGVLAAFDAAADGKPRGGYVANIQGDLAVSANRQGARIEPMSAFRARRKRKTQGER